MVVIQVSSVPYTLYFVYFETLRILSNFGWGWWAYSCVRIVFVVEIFVILPEYDSKLFSLRQFLLFLITRKWFSEFFFSHVLNLVVRWMFDTFGLEKSPYLGVIFVVRNICEVEKTAFELSLIFRTGKITA